jgi:hypothetical protein
MNVARLKIPTIVIAVVALVVGVSSGAVAAKLITGKDIKDNTVTSADIKNGTLVTKDLKQNAINGNRLKKGTVNGAKLQGGTVAGAKLKPGSVGNGKLADGAVTSNKIADGTIGPNDLSTTAFGPNWSIVDRNVIGNGDSYLRAGPSFQLGTQLSQPPLGVGSLGIRTGSGNDKAAFGDQVDFSGDPFTSAAITTLGYSVFTTGENITAGGAGNLPNLQFEINPNLAADTTDVFSTANFIPPGQSPGWSPIDAIGTGEWFLTGVTGTLTGCTQATTCTFAEMMTALNDGGDPASILTVQFSKGRDNAFSGAVDALKIDADTFDFEPFGVTVTTP